MNDVINLSESRYDRKRVLFNLWRYRDPTFPRRMSLTITDHCNRACWYCPNSVFGSKKTMMSDLVFEAALSRMQAIGWNGMVTYNGYGEPTTVTDLERYVARTLEVVPKAKPTIYTNGDFLTAARVRSLLDAGAWHFIVTRHKPYSDAWDSNMKRAIAAGAGRVTCRSLPRNALVNPAGLTSLVYEPFKRCALPSTSLNIRSDGSISMCCADYRNEQPLGNIVQHSIKEIWRNSRPLRLRLLFGRKTDSELCERCRKGK